MDIYQSQMIASKSKGELELPQEVFGEESIKKKDEEQFNVKSRLRTLSDEVLFFYKEKKKVATVILLSTIWIYILYMKEIDSYGTGIRIIEYLFIGRSGEGVLESAGAVFSKIIFSYFMVSTFIPLAIGDYRFKEVKEKLVKFKDIDFRNERSIIAILMGMSISLVVYNFLSAKAVLENNMISIIAIVLVIRSYVESKSGLKLLLNGALKYILKRKVRTEIIVERMIVGIIFGFILSIPVSIVGIDYTGYFLALLITLGLAIYYIMEYRELKR